MRAGRLKDLVEIQAATEIRDTYGQVTKAWVTVATAWAAVVPLKGAERFEAQQVNAQVSHTVQLRYDPAVTLTPRHRLLFGERILNIEQVLNLMERDRTWELLCREEV